MAEVKLDPVRYEIFFNKLDQALNEAQSVVRLLSGSSIVREGGEALEAFYLLTGESVDIAAGILMHFMNITRCIRYMRENKYEAVDIGIYDGDQFMNNDGYVGGMHCPDTGVISPFFYKGEHLGYLAAISHTTETGGIEPGGMCPSAQEAWHDGFHMPVVKIAERGKIRRDVWNMLLRSTRDPRTLEVDLKARMAGNERARIRLKEIIEDFGVDFFKLATAKLVKDGEEFFRARLKQLRPGIYSTRVYCDTVGGIQPPKTSVIQVDLEITEDGMLALRAPVVSPQQAGFNNAYLPAIEATLCYCLLTQVVYDGRWNSGMADAITIEMPEKSRLNADPAQSVGYATVGIGVTFSEAITEAISRAYYASGKEGEVQAPAQGSMNFPIMAGLDRFGRPFGNIVMSHAISSFGSGAFVGRDGMPNYHFYNPWQYAGDHEPDELVTHAFSLFNGFLPDSGSPGKWRSAPCTGHILMIHASNVAFPSFNGAGSKMAGNQGMFGGYPCGCSHVEYLWDTNIYELAKVGEIPNEFTAVANIAEKVQGNLTRWGASAPAVPAKSGDIMTMNMQTGAGLGDPLERDPQLVLKDVIERLATSESSRTVYGVVINQSAQKVDRVKTEKERREKLKDRIKRGMPGGEYLRLQVGRRKRRDLPRPTLDFLDEITNFSPAFKEQLKEEEELAHRELRPLKEVKISEVLFKLTPYVNVVRDEKGNRVCVCSICGFAYCDAAENYQLYCLIYDRDPAEIYPPNLAPDKDFTIYREFYCPGCGTQVEVDQCPPGMTILQHTKIKGINY